MLIYFIKVNDFSFGSIEKLLKIKQINFHLDGKFKENVEISY